ncbi:hypothetical protein J4217_02555 [Candidatus Pacearchaeota archaeon]|nr:hypothetical protein [Candidatus Pacearchaeota archaeon]
MAEYNIPYASRTGLLNYLGGRNYGSSKFNRIPDYPLPTYKIPRDSCIGDYSKKDIELERII